MRARPIPRCTQRVSDSFFQLHRYWPNQGWAIGGASTMKRYWILAIPIAILVSGPAMGQDEEIRYVRVRISITGGGFTHYYAVRVDPRRTPEQQLRAVLHLAPYHISARRRFEEGESYYFFPLCSRGINRRTPARWTIWRGQPRIPLQCP